MHIRREALFQLVTLLGGKFLEGLLADASQLFGQRFHSTLQSSFLCRLHPFF